MFYSINKLLIYGIFLIAILQTIALAVLQPFKYHPYFLSNAILYVTGIIILLTATIIGLRVLELSKTKKLKSTAFLKFHLANLATSENKNFRQRAELYDIKNIVEEIEEAKLTMSKKREQIELLLLSLKNLNYQDDSNAKQFQVLMNQVKQESLQLQQTIDRFDLENNITNYQQAVTQIDINPKILKLKEDDKVFPKKQLQKIIPADEKYFRAMIKDVVELTSAMKMFLTIVPHELNIINQKK